MKKIIPLFLLLFPLITTAQPVADTSFGVAGFSILDAPTHGSAHLHVALQQDGKIILSGSRIGVTVREDCILRLNADGALDFSYATNGYYTIPNVTQDSQGPEIYLLPDDSVVAYSDNLGSLFTKLSPQGMAVSGFEQTAGYSPFDSGQYSMSDPQKNYIYFTQPGPPYGLQRISTATGMLDTSFGNAQHYISLAASSDSEQAVQMDGKIAVITGMPVSGNISHSVKRVLTDGTPDPSFGVGGSTLLYTTKGGFGEFEECMAFDHTSGALYLVSRNWETFDQTTIRKVDANGAPVLAFGNNGSIVLPDNHFVMHVYVHGGHVYVLGRKMLSENFNDCNLMLAKYTLAGQPDTNFGPDGIYVEDGNAFLESGEDLAFTTDGELVVVGETNEPGLHRAFAVKYSAQALQTQKFDAYRVSYQNPVEDLLTVHGTGISKVALFGPDGRLAASGNENSVATSGLASGLYLAQILFTDGHVQTVKISKR